MVNRFYTPTPYQGQLYTPPLDLIQNTFQQLQSRYDQNYLAADEIKNQLIPSMPQDRLRANQLQNQYSAAVDEVISKYDGDYSAATRDLQKLLSKIKKDYGPGGEAGAIIQNYSNYANWVRDSQGLVKSGKALGEDFNEANQYWMRNYKGIGSFDPSTGTYNRFEPETLTEYVDADSILQDVAKNFKPEKVRRSYTTFQNGIQTQTTEEKEGVTPERLYPSFSAALGSNPKYMQYIAQKSKYKGIPIEATLQLVDQYTQQRAQDLSYMSNIGESKSERDPLFLLHERHRLKKEEDKAFLDGLLSFEYNPTTKNSSLQESTLDASNWKNIKTSFNNLISRAPTIAPIPGLIGAAVEMFRNPDKYADEDVAGLAFTAVNPIAGLTTGVVETAGGIRKNKAASERFGKMNLAEAIKDPEFIATTKIDPLIMEDMFNYYKEASPKAFEQYYGKDESWTKLFEQTVVKEYKNQEKNLVRRSDVTIPIPSPEAEEQLKIRFAGELANPKTVAVAPVGSNQLGRADEFHLTSRSMLDAKGKPRQDVRITYNLPGAGSPFMGYRAIIDGKEYVFQDQEVERYEGVGKELQASLGPLFFGNQRYGEPITVGSRQLSDGKIVDVKVKPEIRYEPIGNGLWGDVIYGTNDLGVRAPISILDIYNRRKEDISKVLSTGAPKSSLYNYPIYGQRMLRDE